MSSSLLRASTRQAFKLRSFYSTKAQLESQVSKTEVSVKDVGTPDVTSTTQQAPNRIAPWSASQAIRSDIVDDLRFVQKDLAAQPRPYSAMELIAKQPVRYIEDNIAVCNGNKGRHQGHPKIFMNLDPARPTTCGYCGLKFAQSKYKDIIEADESQ